MLSKSNREYVNYTKVITILESRYKDNTLFLICQIFLHFFSIIQHFYEIHHKFAAFDANTDPAEQ